jgi:arginine deiminase
VGIHVCSETGRLRRAVVHAPGAELLHVRPSNHREFLFNDLVYERQASREHAAFVALLRDVFGVEVLEVRTLLVEALERVSATERLRLLEAVARLEGLGARDRERLVALAVECGGGAEALAGRLIGGEPVGATGPSVGEFLNSSPYHLPPIPNLMLARDLAVTLGDDVFLAWNSQRVRRRENLLWRFVLAHSRLREGTRPHLWMQEDPEPSDEPAYSLEGGNVVQPARDVIVVGQSLRTGAGAVERLTGWLAERATRETRLFILALPAPYDHLDTVFTMLSADECLVFPPSLVGHGTESANVLEVTLRPGEAPEARRRSGLLGPLGEALGAELRAVPCGGDSPVAQRREQWWGGCSALAVAPGKVIAFQSADRTLGELEARGYVRLDGERVLAGDADPWAHERCVVALRGSELSRAKGGPRSLALPLERDCP